jgi:adenine-specific DNA-methyltransferase
VDFDLLRQDLSNVLVEGGQERYRLDWPGKRQALLTANAPIAKTLRPCREESVDFDTTKNLYIEGDNLDALKLLQESYLGKVKMIYIDPPYNTGNDFIYEDDFAEDAEEYLRKSNQKDEEGNWLVLNSEGNGRFHSDWLSMLCARLKLARNLLANDGVIFVSIDDSESANLKHLLDEVLGGGNFIDTISVEMSTTSGPKTVNAQQGTIVKNVEFVHVYRKGVEFDGTSHIPLLDGIDSYDTHYTAWLNENGTLGSLAEQLMLDDNIGDDIRRFELADRGTFSIKKMDKLLSVSNSANAFILKNLKKIARVDRPPVSAFGKSTPVGRWEPFEVDHRIYFLTTLANVLSHKFANKIFPQIR